MVIQTGGFQFQAYTNTESFALDAPTLDLKASSDTGVSDTDDITGDPTPSFTVTFGQEVLEGDIFKLRVNGVIVAEHTVTALEAGNGTINLLLDPLEDLGVYALQGKHISGLDSSDWGPTLTIELAAIDWQPDDEASLVAWFDAQTNSTVEEGTANAAEDGDSVANWLDLHGDVSLTGEAGAGTPTYRATGLDGFPAIEFVAGNEGYFTSGSADMETAATVMSVFGVFRMDSATANYGRVLAMVNGGGADYATDHSFAFSRTATNDAIEVAFNSGSPLASPITMGATYVFSIICNDTAWSLRLNGVEVDTATVASPTWGTGGGQVYIGAASGAEMDGMVGEVLFFKTAADATLISNAEEYLTGRWS